MQTQYNDWAIKNSIFDEVGGMERLDYIAMYCYMYGAASRECFFVGVLDGRGNVLIALHPVTRVPQSVPHSCAFLHVVVCKRITINERRGGGPSSPFAPFHLLFPPASSERLVIKVGRPLA